MAEIDNELNAAQVARGKRTANTASFVMISKVLSVLINGIGVILIARILGPSTYGIYSIAIASAGLFGAFGDFGIGTAIVKFVSEHLERKNNELARKVVANGFLLLFIIGVVFTTIAFFFGSIMAQSVLHNQVYALVFEIAAFTIITGLLYGTANYMLIGFGEAKHLAATIGLQSSVQVALGVSLALLGFGAMAPVLGLIAGALVGFFYAFVPVLRRLGNGTLTAFSKSEIKKMLRFSLPIGIPAGTIGLVNNFAFILLGVYVSTQVLGNYGIALKTSTILDLVVGSIGIVMLPLFSAAMSSKKEKGKVEEYFNYSIYVTSLVVAPLIAYLAILAKPFSYVAFSGLYSLAPTYIAIVAIGTFISTLGWQTNSLLVSASKVKDILVANVSVAIITFLLIPVLIPELGGLGITILLFVVQPIASDALLLWYAKKRLGITPDWKRLFKVVGSAALSSMFILPLVYIFAGNFIALLVAAAMEQILLYPIILAYARAIDSKTTSSLHNIIPKIPVLTKAVDLMLQYTSFFIERI